MSACRDGHSTRLDCMHLGSLWGHGRVPNHSTSPSYRASADQLFVEAAPSLPGQQCRSGRSLCLPPLVKVGNTKTNSGDRRDRLEHMSPLHSLPNTAAIKIPTPNADLAPN